MERTQSNEPRTLGADGGLQAKEIYAALQRMKKVIETIYEILVDSRKEHANQRPQGQPPTYNNCHDFYVGGAFSTFNITIVGKEEEKPNSKYEEALLVEEKKETRELPEELRTEAARALLAKFQHAGMLDGNYQYLVSQKKAAILASVMSDELNLKPRWATFEELWGIDDLANKLSQAQNCNYYSDFLREVEDTIG